MDEFSDHLSVRISLDPAALFRGLNDATRRLQSDLTAASERSGQLAETALSDSFDKVASSIGAAALSGELSFKSMIDTIVQEFGRLAIQEFIQAPVRGALSGLFGSLVPGGSFGGARMTGGPVQPHRAFLVGERGPELFVPNRSGAVLPGGRAGAAQIVFNIQTPDAESFRRSESQLAAMALRTLQRGQRNL